MLEPQSVALEHIKFHDDEMRVSYSFSVDGEDRVLSYDVGDVDALKAEVRPTLDGNPLIELFANRRGVRARTSEGEFTLRKGTQVLPPATDERSVWLLAQNFLTNTTTSPQAHLARVAASLPADRKVAFGRRQAGESSARLFPWVGEIWDWFMEDDCLSPNQSTDCTEQDQTGKINTVHFTCDCGIPICTNVTMTVDVPIMIFDLSTGTWTAGTETVTYTVCFCYCIEMSS